VDTNGLPVRLALTPGEAHDNRWFGSPERVAPTNDVARGPRIATRYDKLAANYLAFVKLASIQIRLRANESAP
jgi:hypothetical protein